MDNLVMALDATMVTPLSSSDPTWPRWRFQFPPATAMTSAQVTGGTVPPTDCFTSDPVQSRSELVFPLLTGPAPLTGASNPPRSPLTPEDPPVPVMSAPWALQMLRDPALVLEKLAFPVGVGL